MASRWLALFSIAFMMLVSGCGGGGVDDAREIQPTPKDGDKDPPPVENVELPPVN